MQHKIFFTLKIKETILFLYCLLTICGYSQEYRNTSKIDFAINTYAFLKGQDAALKMIALQFPSLRDNVVAAKKNSEVLFVQAEQNIEHFLDEQLDKNEFNILKNRIRFLLSSNFEKPIEKKKQARDFIDKVRYRSKLIEDESISNAVLSFAYHDTPHLEINDGHVKTFTTRGHPKTEKSAIITIPIPKSWKADEAQMPETIQQFTSFDGNGNEKILIVIYDLPKEEPFILSESSIPEIISHQTTLIRTERVTIDGRQGMMVECEETLNSKTKIRMMQFMLVEEQKLYCLQGSIGPVAASENLEIPVKKYEPFFRLIASRARIDK